VNFLLTSPTGEVSNIVQLEIFRVTINKEEVTRAIFGVSRSDGYDDLIPLTDTQETAIFDTLVFTNNKVLP
jgi:hypothetical protein